ncbi:MAG: hypothetical protein CMO40_04690 [Verrucomicrobiaceae bacterium]|nr:hypothetical protein [Verrucomicrobiaceae bacterium]
MTVFFWQRTGGEYAQSAMRFSTSLLLVAALWPVVLEAGRPEKAALIRNEYESAAGAWARKLAVADPQAQLNVWKNRPDSSAYGRRMWEELKDSLRAEWSIEYCVWLLERSPVFAGEADPGMPRTRAQVILQTLSRHHLKSPEVGMLCLALTSQPDSTTLRVIERVESENPHEAVQGQASLAIALLLKGLGDDREVIERRINKLRQAIIKAHDVKVGDTTVSRLAMDEIFVIQHLVKGRTAPDAIGRDSSGEPFKLSMLKGKVTVFAFWHTNMRDAERGLALLQELQEQYGNRGMDLVGVTSDSLEVLRSLRANGTVSWRNFADVDGRIHNQFRVKDLPIVYVLDSNRKILYIGGPGAFVDLTVEGLLAR